MQLEVGRLEYELIAAVLTEGDSQRRSQVIDGITPEMFNSSLTARCWTAIKELHEEGEMIDMFCVGDRMGGGKEDRVWCMEVATDHVTYSSQFMHYAKKVRQAAYAVDVMKSAQGVVDYVANMTDVTQTKNIASVVQGMVDSMMIETSDRKPQLFKDVAKDYVEKLTDKLNGKADEHIVLSGIPDLDYHTGGFNKTDLIVMAGLSGSGKTEAVIDVIRGTTAEDGGALIFSLEMSNSQVVERAVSGQSQLPVSSLRNPAMLEETPNGWARMEGGLGELVNRDIYLEDQTGLTVQDIVIRAKRHKRDHPSCKLVAVDHIGLMNLGKVQTRHDLAVGEITKELKNLAKEIETPVVILSQLTGKQIMQRPILDREPRAQDIKDSSRIEEDADLIIMLHRQYTHDDKAPNIAEWILAKARHAIKGTKVYFRFINGHFSATDQAYAFNEMDAYKNSLTPVKKQKPANLK